MTKTLIVLAECVDIRNGKRFQPGEEFKPAPNPEQAKRLIAAGCLTEAAAGEAKAEPYESQPSPAPENVEMRTEAGERAARAADETARERSAEKAKGGK